MIKRRRNSGSGEDLADVNEQELAKDGGADRLLGGDVDENGADGAAVGKTKSADVKNTENTVTAENAEPVDTAYETDKNGMPKETASDGGLPLPSDGERQPIKSEKHSPKCEDGGVSEKKEEREGSPKNKKKESEAKHKRGRGYIAVIAACFIISVALLALSVIGERRDNGEGTVYTHTEAEETTRTETRNDATLLGANEIYGLCAECAVTVAATTDGGTSYYSGFCIFGGGYVASLYEAVAEASKIEIILSDGSIYPTELVGGNATVNLALLRSAEAPLKSVDIGSAENLVTGSSVYAIGSMGEGSYGASFVACEVSFSQRYPELLGFDGYVRRVGAIQISGIFDSAMKGCPIFNENGEAAALMLCVDGSVSFALPLDKVSEVLSAIKDGEEPSVETLYSLAYIPPRLGILGEQTERDGIYGICVKGFDDENGDAALKLRIDDVIFKINNRPTPDAPTLSEEIEKYRPGDSVEIFVYRSGQRLSFSVYLSEAR